MNFEEGYRVRYLQDDFSRTISSEITDCVLLLSINMCHKGKPCPEKEKQNNTTCCQRYLNRNRQSYDTVY